MNFRCLYKIFFSIVIMTCLLTACSEKKVEKDIITRKEVKKGPSKPISMQDYNHSEKIEWLGQQYTVSIGRRAENDSSLVADESGNRYHNNKITVRIVRSDGSTFFDKTFSKNDFASAISSDYMKKSTLLGIVVDHTEGGTLFLAASVGAPDVLSDEFVPFLISITRMGDISITKDTRPETSEEPTDEEI